MIAKQLPHVILAMVAATASLSAQETLKNQGTEWSYLLYRSAIDQAIDPANVDGDFHSTWFDPTALGYDGPTFLTGNGYFGYGVIGNPARTITTGLWDAGDPTATPPTDQRFTAYFVTEVTPTLPVTNLRFTGVIDDGAIIYVNGAELTRLNMLDMALAPEAFSLFSDGAGDENNPISTTAAVVLPANVPAVIAVSMHSASMNSSDMGFDLTIESVVPVAPANDDFVNAAVLPAALPFLVVGSTNDGVGGLGATKEAGEPDHAGDAGGGSVWLSWTPDADGRVSVSTAGSDFDTLLAVYTGGAVNSLTPVPQYANLVGPAENLVAASADDPFHAASYVEFDAVMGTTYYIAVDGAGGAFGNIAIAIDSVFTFLDPLVELLPAGSPTTWDYLLYTETQLDTSELPIDPETVDVDFDTTWQRFPPTYDGPAFTPAGPALLGYGVIDNHPFATDIWGGRDADGDGAADPAPLTGERYASYFRTKFTTPNAPVQHVGFEGLIDDGAIIYFDGVEVARINVAPGADAADWQVFAIGANHDRVLASGLIEVINNELDPQTAFALDLNLPANTEIDVAVSLHSSSATSSDQGLNLRIYAVNPPPPAPDPPSPPNFWVDVDETDQAGEYEVTWPSTVGSTYQVEWSEDGVSFLILGQAIAADPSGINSFLDFPGTLLGLYRVTDETTVP